MVEGYVIGVIYPEHTFGFHINGDCYNGSIIAVPIVDLQDIIIFAAHGEVDIIFVRAHALCGIAGTCDARVRLYVLEFCCHHMKCGATLTYCVASATDAVGYGTRAVGDIYVFNEGEGIGVNYGKYFAFALTVCYHELIFGGIKCHVVGVAQIKNITFRNKRTVIKAIFTDNGTRIV